MKEKIKNLFAFLTEAEQIELLKELSSNSRISISIAEFSIQHQKRYGRNIEFSIEKSGLDHAPTITATVHTAFGNFKGTGSNQKIAKANAVKNAYESMSF